MGYDRKYGDKQHSRFGRDNYHGSNETAGSPSYSEGNKMDWEDEELKCVDCGDDFTFRGKDKRFYQKMGYQKPKRCLPCRNKNKARIEQQKQNQPTQ